MPDEKPLPNDEQQANSQHIYELQDDELDQVVGGTAPYSPGGAIISALFDDDAEANSEKIKRY